MVDFSFSEEEEVFRRTLRELLSEVLAPKAREIDRGCRIPADVIKTLAESGILLLTVKPEYGGQGASWVMGTIATEEIARADPSVATAVFHLVEASWGKIVERYAKPELAKDILSRAAKGEGFVGICSTEPQSGSDVAGFKTLAKKEGDHWVLNGEKTYISGIVEAKEVDGGYVTLVKTKPEAGSKGISLFWLPINTPGIETGIFEDMGRCGISTGWIRLNNVKLPEDHLIGKVNGGFELAMEGFNRARVFVAAGCTGSAMAMFEYTRDYVKSRTVFGRSLASFEGIQFPLVDYYAKIEAARLVMYKAAWMVDQFDQGNATLRDVGIWAATVKLLAPEIAVDALKEFMKATGAYGYTKDAPLEMALRGVISYYVGAEGGQNIMRLILGRFLFGPGHLPYKHK
ncbi:MAG: acyl-CoA dehydrogenase family protein [Candidatus Korarchaeum sp.]